MESGAETSRFLGQNIALKAKRPDLSNRLVDGGSSARSKGGNRREIVLPESVDRSSADPGKPAGGAALSHKLNPWHTWLDADN